ncbi:MAG: hypothetical protein ABIK89_01305 [Planctomycetota bacterium]
MTFEKRCSLESCHHRVDGLAGDESQKVVTITAPSGYVVDRVEDRPRGNGRWVRLVLSSVAAAVTIVWAVAAVAG